MIALPEPLARYFSADASGDAAVLANCFADDGVVIDEGGTYTGSAEIRLWNEEAKEKYRYTVEPVSVAKRDGQIVVVGKIAGDFPGSPVTLEHIFSIVDNKITALEIR